MPNPERAGVLVLPMELHIGDRFIDDTGKEWEVISRPYTSAGDKLVNAHVRRVGRPDLADLRIWGAHERIAVKRTIEDEKQ